MRIYGRHIGLIVGTMSMMASLLFFGRSHDIYHLVSLFGMLTALTCFIWILVGKESSLVKLIWVGIVGLAIAIHILTAPYIIDTSYRIYIAGQKELLSDVNQLLESSRGDVWIINDSISTSNDEYISPDTRQQLLKAKKQLGVYMIFKSDSTIYYGLWGFLDVRLGINYLAPKAKPGERYRHLTGRWYH